MSRCGVFAKDIKKREMITLKVIVTVLRYFPRTVTKITESASKRKKDLSGFKASSAQFLHRFHFSLIVGLINSGVRGRASCGPASGRKQTEKEG